MNGQSIKIASQLFCYLGNLYLAVVGAEIIWDLIINITDEKKYITVLQETSVGIAIFVFAFLNCSFLIKTKRFDSLKKDYLKLKEDTETLLEDYNL